MKSSDIPNGKRQLGNILNAVIVLSVIAIAGSCALLYKRPTSSLIEKRDLATFPEFSVSTLFEGSYMRELSAFFADTFPSRDRFVKIAGVLKENSGVRFGDIRIHSGTNTGDNTSQNGSGVGTTPELPGDIPPPTPELPSVLPSVEPPAVPPPDATLQPDTTEPGVRKGAIYVYKGRGYQIFGGGDAMGTQYANVINKYQEVLGDKVQIYNMVIPSAIEFGIPKIYQSITVPELPRIENVIASLNPKVKGVNIHPTFKKHSDEYLYFATDHHWTSLGAYYAYEEFCKTAGTEPVKLETLEKRTLNNFLGTLYSQTQDSTMLKNVDHVDYYMMKTPHQVYQYRKDEPFTPRSIPLYGEYALPVNSYSVFLHGDFPMIRIDTDIKNGRRIAVVKESYGNAIIPFLVNNYEQIFVVDQRYFQRGLLEIIEENNINELLFINNIFAAHSGNQIAQIERIMNQRYVPPPPPPPETETPVETEEENETPNEPTGQ